MLFCSISHVICRHINEREIFLYILRRQMTREKLFSSLFFRADFIFIFLHAPILFCTESFIDFCVIRYIRRVTIMAVDCCDHQWFTLEYCCAIKSDYRNTPTVQPKTRDDSQERTQQQCAFSIIDERQPHIKPSDDTENIDTCTTSFRAHELVDHMKFSVNGVIRVMKTMLWTMTCHTF